MWEDSNPKWFSFPALISFSAHISWNNGFTAILTKFLPFRKGEVFYEKNQFPNGFLFRSIISFFAYISWNNGFTAIWTKFLPFTKGEVFYEKNQFTNGFRFRSIISFFAYISWNNGFTAILTKFSCHQSGRYIMRRIKLQMVFILGLDFVFCTYIVKLWFYGDFDEIFAVYNRGGIYEKNQFPNGFLFRALISFFVYISWNNGFTAI